MNRFQNKAIIVTGAASGLGRALALQVAKEGASVVAADVNAESLEEVAAEIARVGARVHQVPCDAADPATGGCLAGAAMDEFGRIDGFVPCAGIIRFQSVTEIDPAQWDTVMTLNLRGVFFAVQAVGNAMVAGGCKGSIVAISSTGGDGPRPDCADYGISKAGINQLTRTFALKLAPRGIRVNAVSGGGSGRPCGCRWIVSAERCRV